jgi:Uma2 family endonuclease
VVGAVSQFEYMSFDDFEEMLQDKPDNERWELIGGRVIRGTVGTRWEHERISGNIYIALQTGFRKKASPCRAFKETFYLKRRALDLTVFPDIIVRCGEIERGQTSVDDPTALIEVLSPGTEPRDRYEKWDRYKELPSLRHYVLVHRDKPMIEVRSRQGDIWTVEIIEGLDQIFALPALDFEMALAAVYEDVLAG